MTAGKHTIHVGSYNVHKAVGTDRRRKPERIAAVIAEMAVDILALQEVDTRFGERKGILDLAGVESELGLMAARSRVFGLAHGFHGNLLLVRNAEVQDVHYLPLPGLEPRGALIADLVIGKVPMRVVSAHLGLIAASRRAQVRTILDKLSLLDKRPALLMGDLNERRVGGGSSLRGLAEHFPNAPTVPSFPSRYPLFRLDRIMASSNVAVSELAAHDTPLARSASDHLPIRARLEV
ncbi:MAG: endonuclease [Cereibacter sphaeroides]|uniref:Endonuclease n=1 Tax=Cereibacter sphaeroides TaxID=1063 RepID=A0A2W5TVX5_CERSP|nr:MAG: endonuclease [Cereibacter sphaeroides]